METPQQRRRRGEGPLGSVSGGSVGLLGWLPCGHLPTRKGWVSAWHQPLAGTRQRWDFWLFPANTWPLPRCRGACRPHRPNHHHSSQEHQRGGRDLGGDHGVRGQRQVGSASPPPPSLPTQGLLRGDLSGFRKALGCHMRTRERRKGIQSEGRTEGGCASCCRGLWIQAGRLVLCGPRGEAGLRWKPEGCRSQPRIPGMGGGSLSRPTLRAA